MACGKVAWQNSSLGLGGFQAMVFGGGLAPAPESWNSELQDFRAPSALMLAA